MGPKKNQITASTPAVANPSATFGGISDNSGPSTINESSFVIGNVEDVVVKQPAIPKASTLDLIFMAIETIGVPRKGASYMAIQKWIINNKEIATVNRLKSNMKKAIVKALESGLLKRPAASKNVTGLRGYFIVSKEVKIPKPKTVTAPKPKAAVKSKSNTEEATSAKTKAGKSKSNTKNATSAKPKTKSVESKTNTEEATSAKPKTKAVELKSDTEKAISAKTKTKAVKSKSDTEKATSAKTKTKAVKSKSDTEKATSAKTKTKAVKSKSDTEKATSAKTKTKAVKSKSDTEKATSSKSKTKAVKSKSDTESGSSGKASVKSNPGKTGPKANVAKPIPDSEDLSIPKPKAVRSRVNGVKVPTQEELNSVRIPKKVPKNTSKPTNSVKDNLNDFRRRKLYTSRVNSATNISRKDLSDTELNVKPDNRKSLKSYSSDTEVEVNRNKVAKVTKTKKIADAKKVKEARP